MIQDEQLSEIEKAVTEDACFVCKGEINPNGFFNSMRGMEARVTCSFACKIKEEVDWAVAEEREACARLVDVMDNAGLSGERPFSAMAAAIRARG